MRRKELYLVRQAHSNETRKGHRGITILVVVHLKEASRVYEIISVVIMIGSKKNNIKLGIM